MTDIVLFEANGRVHKSSPAIRQCKVLPLSLKYLQASLQKAGHECVVLAQENKTEKELIQEIVSYSPLVVGATATTCEFPITSRLMTSLKKRSPSLTTVVGGYHVSAYPESLNPALCPPDTNPKGIDFLVVGEGEKTLVKLVESVKNGSSDKNIPGLVYFEKGQLNVNGPSERIRQLDTLPIPQWTNQELEYNDFDGMISRKKGEKGYTVAVVSERGCPFGCSFCSTQKVYGKNVERRSIPHLADEIEGFVRNKNADMIVDYAPTGNLDSQRIHEFCEEIRRRGLEKTFSMYALWRLESPNSSLMIDNGAVEDLAKTLWCFKAGIGVEAFNQEDARFLGKEHSLENLKAASEIFDRYGAIFRGFYMITPKTTLQTVKTCSTNDSLGLFDDLRVTYSTPFPGTLLYEQNRDKLMTPNWGDFTCEQPVLTSDFLNVEQLASAKNEILQGFLLNPYRHKRIQEKLQRFPELVPGMKRYHEKMAGYGFKVLS